MRRLLIFLFLLSAILTYDIKPVNLNLLKNKGIHVTVEGEVTNPGIYELETYSSIDDLLNRLQLTDEADISGINPQIILKDKDILVIPKAKDIDDLIISINSASVNELITLPGIGEKTAEQIIQYRDSNGLFQTTDEIMNVKGIGNEKYNKIRDFITL